ncbi:glycosyltransferase [Pseudoalteromonas luteoviolacea]|uniref:glycosyltransferase n=1 Tax=Pseudoalteromonas luteoviolacea TaxID=43657 RepID=UPI0011529B13|nr:glycosyltransferase [Pseudoalteromonas luteoviolacea]TQF72207.1 glycosyltransferase [Pseudoalteromonas luteoviolacea]
MKNIDFSVLCSLYFKEQPEFLDDCLKSIFDQSLQASEIVVVHDGPLTDALYAVLEKWRKLLLIKDVVLEQNVGLGEALNKGLSHCSYDLVVRVDTDDINLKSRFHDQITFMNDNPGVAVSSSYIEEFDKTPNESGKLRRVPTANILAHSVRLNPINHMASVFRKHKIIASGGYKHLMYMEDYYLWLRVLASGEEIANLDKVLVKARTGNGMLERRRGTTYAKSEIKLMKHIFKLGLSKSPLTFAYFLSRSISRLMPAGFLRVVYRFLRTS